MMGPIMVHSTVSAVQSGAGGAKLMRHGALPFAIFHVHQHGSQRGSSEYRLSDALLYYEARGKLHNFAKLLEHANIARTANIRISKYEPHNKSTEQHGSLSVMIMALQPKLKQNSQPCSVKSVAMRQE